MLWTKATKYGKLPSEIVDRRGRWDDLTRYQFDNAVTVFGSIIENMLAETVEVITYVQGKKQTSHKPKYRIGQLLDPDFRLPRPAPQPTQQMDAQDGFGALLALAKQGPRSGVKMYKYVGPEVKEV